MISEKLIFWNSEDLITLDGPQNFSFSGFQKISLSPQALKNSMASFWVVTTPPKKLKS
jgi:hypothetical protein